MARLEKHANFIRLVVEPQDQILEIGRQSKDDPPPLAVVVTPSHTRLVIASREQIEIGRRQLRIEIAGPRKVRLTNINDNNSITLPTGVELNPGDSFDSPLPLRLNRGGLHLSVEIAGQESLSPADTSELFQSMAESPHSPQTMVSIPKRRSGSLISPAPQGESFVASLQNSNTTFLLDRLEQLVSVLQLVASSTDFSRQIAQTAVEMVNLDRAAVLLLEGDQWKIVAAADPNGSLDPQSWRPSQTLLNQLLRTRRTLWGKPGAMNSNPTESIAIVLALVAAPILDPDGKVIGAVYGDRRIGGNSSHPPIDQFDAKLVEIMACGVAGGWARVEHEQTAIANRIQFERFVTKEVARSLEEDPDALIGRDAEVTLLFCDITGFSRISEQLSPKETFDWINAVMEALSQCVLATNGTLVDYVGDELIAMWGAPFPRPDHAAAATETAILMLDALKTLNNHYSLPGNESTQVGIGLNSGKVRVGNTGSAHKLKYGPLGSHVNIASRVQGATRYLRTPALITGDTARELDGKFSTRRLCSVRLKNIEQPVELYELAVDAGPEWPQFAIDYERALVAWEQGHLQSTIEILSQLIARNSQDGPTMVLLSRAVDAWSMDLHEYDPVWTLASK